MADPAPTVVVNPLPTAAPQAAAIVAGARPTVTVTDSRGRKITVEKLNALQIYRLAKIMGGASDSQVAFNLATAAAAVRSIDGSQELFPGSEPQIEAIFQRLDMDGLDAAGEALKALSPNKGLEPAKN